MNPDTGAFSSKAALQGLSIRSPIHFKVTARDRGTPPKFGVTYVEVNITSGQLDDGLPVWTRPAPGITIDVMEASYNFWITKGDNLNIPKICLVLNRPIILLLYSILKGTNDRTFIYI